MREIRILPSDLGMEPLGAYSWPLTIRWTMSTGWGFTQQTLTVNAPGAEADVEKTKLLGSLLWSLTIAPAISRQVRLELTEIMPWRAGLVPFVVPGNGEHGQHFAGAAEREHTGQVVMMTGDPVGTLRRRLFLPGMPSGWAQDGLLTRDGWEGIISHARALYMGLGPTPPGTQVDWLIAYPYVTSQGPDNPYGVAFRRVTSLRVCQHTDRAPDFALGLWP